MTNEILLKEIAPQWVASLREVIPAYSAVGLLFAEAFDSLGADGEGGVPAALWHDPEYKEKDVDAEACVYLKTSVPARGRLRVYQLPAATVASTVHEGAYNRLTESYDAVRRWIESNSYRIAGPFREIYLKYSTEIRQDDESYVTEIQIPVEKLKRPS